MSGVITGRVIDATGAPIAGATVAVNSRTQPVSDIASLTDAGGHFRRGGLAPGSYTLDVHKAGQPTRTIDVDVADGQQTNLEIRLGDPVIGNPVTGENSVLEVALVTDRIDWRRVLMVRVALDYPGSGRSDAAGKDYILTAGNHDAEPWEVPLSEGTPDEYIYTIEYFLANGSRKTVPPTRGSDRTLVLDPQA